MRKQKKATEQQHPFMKMADMKDMKKFMDKYPTDEHFFADYPQARYGYMMKADDGLKAPGIAPNVFPAGPYSTPADRPIDSASGASQLNLPGDPNNPRWQSVQSKLDVEENVRGLNEAGQMPQQGGYQAAQGPAFEGQMSEEEQQQPQDKKGKGKRKYKVSTGDKSWSPFAKDNAWNTGSGVKTTDLISGAVSVAAGALPYQPARQNIEPLQMGVTTGGYGYGSHAAFEDGGMMAGGGKLSAKKARTILHDGTVHGKPITEKQRKYFGAVASGYADDGAPMITQVTPSPYTHFMPMTRQNRQIPETPNYYSAADGISMQPNMQIPGVGGFQTQPVSPQEREQWNQYQAALSRVPGQGVINWGSNQDIQKQVAKQTGFDYNRAAAIQADMMQRSKTMPGSVTGITGTDPWGGKPGWVGSREKQKGYSQYEYTHLDPKGNVISHMAPTTEPMSKEQMSTWIGAPTQRSTALPVASTEPIGMGFGSTAASSTAPLAKGFPTMEEAKARSKAKPQKENWYAGANKPTGDIRGNEMRNGGEIAGMYHPGDDDQRMVYPYPTKIGGHYHPYDHTYMAMGGMVPIGEQGLQVEGNQFRYLSPQTVELVGPKHSQGGIDISYNGTKVEAEGGETFHVDDNGMSSGNNMAASGTSINAGIVGGNLYVPGTNTKFKDAFKDVAKVEKKSAKLQDKASYFLNEYSQVDNGPKNKFSAPAFNFGKVMADAHEQKKAEAQEVKDYLTETQNKMLELGAMIHPEDGAKKVSQMFKGKAKWGMKMGKGNTTMAKDGISIDINKIIQDSAQKYNIPLAVARKLVMQESGGNTSAVSDKGAIGHMQMMPETAKKYGVSKEQLSSNEPKDIKAVTDAGMHYLSDMAKMYNNDMTLALAAYNGGPAAVNYVKDNLDKDVITGEDLVNFYKKMRETNPTKDPHAWQNETLNYVSSIYPEGVKGTAAAPDIQGYNPPEYDTSTAVSPGSPTPTTGTPANPYERNLLDKILNNQATVAEIREYNNKYGRQADEQNAIDYEGEGMGIKNYDPNKAYAQEFDEDGTMRFVEDTAGYEEPTGVVPGQPLGPKMLPAEPGQLPSPQLRTDIPTLPDMKTSKQLNKDEAIAKKKGKGLRNKFRVTDYLGQLKTMFDKAEPVQSMQVKPFMETPYNVSFQNEKNAIQSAFAPALKTAKTPAQQAAISAQMAEQLANVDAKEFQFNQQNRGQIEARNLGEMRGVRDTNLRLGMDAMEKTQRAKAITEADKLAAAQSISTGEAARRAKNLELGMYEQYGGYQYDPKTQKYIRLAPPSTLEEPVAYIQDPSKKEKVVETEDQDKQGRPKKKKQTTTTDTEQYYGGQIAYFGMDMPAAIPRRYFGGGAMGGGHAGGGHGGHGAGGHHGGMRYMGDMMASRYQPGDDSYYTKKKKKKHHRKS